MPSVPRYDNICVQPMLSKLHRAYLPFGHSLSTSLAAHKLTERQTKIYFCSPYHAILAPDRVMFAVPIPLAVPLNRVHCPQRFRPRPCRMAGRILEAELQVVLLMFISLQHIFMQLHVANLVAQGLTALRPIRTLRDSLPSQGSSPSKADISRPAHYCSTSFNPMQPTFERMSSLSLSDLLLTGRSDAFSAL